MRVVRVARQDADEALRRLLAADLVERGRRVVLRGADALVPLRAPPPAGTLEGVAHVLGEVDDGELPRRAQRTTPHASVVELAMREGWPPAEVALLPNRWERLGRVVVLKLPEGLDRREREAAGLYARVLRVGAVLREVGGVEGVERRPSVRLVWGEGSVTVHREHGVAYEFDAAAQMFSKGNVEERLRMGRAVHPGETVVDMFAGIGYFTLPMAVLGRPKRVAACEIDPGAHAWLVRNVRRNRVGGVVEPLLGDCREVAPRGAADRVVMGYVGGTAAFLPAAIAALAPGGGVVHFHDKYPVEDVPARPLAAVEEAARGAGRTARLLCWREVKSFAPGIVHAVLDVGVR
jgi:tRNA wybutosine-synthesizing protein 2